MARILVVDDDITFRAVLCEMLFALGHEVDDVSSGAEGFERFRHDHQIVLTDLLMPGSDGFETIRFFRRNHPKVRIIAMSGGGRIGAATYLEMAEHLGASYVLVKPFSRDDLRVAIEAALT